MESPISYDRLKQQFRITEIAAWTLVTVLFGLIQADLLEVPSRAILYTTFGVFLSSILFIHHILVKKIAIKKCFVLESFSFLLFTAILIHFTGDAHSPFWLFYYLPIMISLMVLDANFCLWILAFTTIFSMLEMGKAFMSGDAGRLPILILNVFSLVALTILGYLLTQLLVQEKVSKDEALKARDEAITERDRHLHLLEEKNEKIEEFSAKLGAVNQELMSQQTELLRVMEELEKANRELKKMDEIKSDFISMVSHELRTPLTVIKETVALLNEEKSDLPSLDRKKFLGIMQNNVDRLSRLIQDVLDFSKLESGTMKMKKTKVDACALVRSVEETFGRTLADKKIDLKFSLPKDLIFVWADPGRLRQVLDNLVGNAIKFISAPGVIELGIECSTRDTVLKAFQTWRADAEIFTLHEMAQTSLWKNFVTFWVRDTGVGIPRKDVNRVFEKFLQLDVHESRPKGTGLGLAIVKQLVLAHQGGLWVESEVDKGTTFNVALPTYEEVNQRLEQMDEWTQKVLQAKGKSSLMLIDFMDGRLKGRSWLEYIQNMEKLVYHIQGFLDEKKEQIFLLNAFQYMILQYGGESLDPLKLVERIREGITKSSFKDLEKVLRFRHKNLESPRLNVEDLLQKIEALRLEVNRDR